MKKKIAFVIFVGATGGVEEALVNMLNAIDYTLYQVDLYTNIKKNPWLTSFADRIPQAVNFYDVFDYTTKKLFCLYLKKWKLFRCIKLCYSYTLAKRATTETKRMEILSKGFPISEIKYDCVIAYKMNYDTVNTALHQIIAEKKIFWVHGYLWNYPEYDPVYLSWISQFDHIFAVSETVMEETCSIISGIRNKTSVFYNIMDCEYIWNKSNALIPGIESEMPGTIKILTVSRLDPVKNITSIPYICKRIVDQGINISWYIIGDGSEYDKIAEQIKINNVEGHVILLGSKENPYPYFQRCDMYIQPSLHEGRSIAVIEAQILHKPVIITDYSSARDQLKNNIDGFIVSLDSDKCADEIIKILGTPSAIKKAIENTKKIDYSGRFEIEKLYTVLNDYKEERYT